MLLFNGNYDPIQHVVKDREIHRKKRREREAEGVEEDEERNLI